MTEKNNESMKTVVETFLVEETVELIYDNEKLDKWNELIGELKLKGQQGIVHKDKSPIPFMFMNNSLKNIFTELCPQKVSVEDYGKTPIPVEILDLISLSVKEKYFNNIQIWYNDTNPDPVCVGKIGYYYEMSYYSDSNEKLKNKHFDSKQEVIDAGGKHPSYSVEDSYLIGRWADVKKSLPELKKDARDRYIENHNVNLKKELKNIQRKIDDIDINADLYINGEYIPF